jgi:NAD(P)-dependent dehydrogenase (short-subunit alcohol dehydrogenase family)
VSSGNGTIAIDGALAGNALVTGGSRGIGRACALAAARRGADVAITYVANADAAEETATEIRALGRRAITIQGDVGDPADNVAAVEATVAELGPIRYLVANAAAAAERAPLGAALDPEEIGAPVAFLLSDEARMVTGQTLCVDAGFTLPG